MTQIFPNSVMSIRIHKHYRKLGVLRGRSNTWYTIRVLLQKLQRAGVDTGRGKRQDRLVYVFNNLPAPSQAATSRPYKPSQAFYNSWSWKRLRYQVLLKYGPVCMLCGSTEKIVVDHILPISKYPQLRLEFDNLQVLCESCNMGKSNTDYTDFRPGAPVEPKLLQ